MSAVRHGVVQRGAVCGGELGPAGALEVLARGEAEEGGAVPTCVEHEERMRGCMPREREQDRAGAGRDPGHGRSGVPRLRDSERGKGGRGEKDDVGVWDELSRQSVTRGVGGRETDRFDAVTGAPTEVDGDDAVGAPFALAGEAVDADEVGDGRAHAAALEVEPVERGG